VNGKKKIRKIKFSNDSMQVPVCTYPISNFSIQWPKNIDKSNYRNYDAELFKNISLNKPNPIVFTQEKDV
jgi:hypothetical protein